MLKDLQQQYNLTQLHSDEIIDLLGSPERIDTIEGNDCCYMFQYYCGVAQGERAYGYFNLYFNEENRCVRTEKKSNF